MFGGKGKERKGKEKEFRHLRSQEIDLLVYTPSRAGGGESGRKEEKKGALIIIRFPVRL